MFYEILVTVKVDFHNNDLNTDNTTHLNITSVLFFIVYTSFRLNHSKTFFRCSIQTTVHSIACAKIYLN